MLKLTPEEIERYAPYHTMPAFEWGFDDYGRPEKMVLAEPFGVDGQAYDRGAECAMRRQRTTERPARPLDETDNWEDFPPEPDEPSHCQVCGCEIWSDETPCEGLEYGYRCGIALLQEGRAA